MNTLSAENEMEFRKSIHVRFKGRTMPIIWKLEKIRRMSQIKRCDTFIQF